ncbi:MAG: DUF4249 domain-containing protein, partial [Cyclobacteriaceae bacterium]|nr:DUF4249 domain-containing protein [Cyclobacteriaceae bacterium]
KIEVIEPDYISINSELTIPQVIPVFEIVEIKEVQDNTSNYLEFTISIADSPGDSFYLLEVYYYNYIYDYQQDPPVITDSVRYGANAETADPLLGSTGGFYNSSILFDDQLFKNKTGVGKFRVGNNYFNGVGLFSARFVEISLKEITRDYYLYKKSTELQRNSVENPLAEPVIVYSNIQNGFGIFGGYVQALRDTFYVFQ